MNTPWAIFDLDGCVSDDYGRAHHWRAGDYDAYHSLLHLDPAIKVAYDQLWTWYGKDGSIVFITARPDKYVGETKKWISEHIGLQDHDCMIFMRPVGDKRSSPELKRDLMWRAMSLCFNCIAPDAVFDDRDDVLQMYADEGIKCIYKMTRDGQERYVPGKVKRGPAERLAEGAALFAERNAVYGDNHLTFGRVAHALWPDGLTVKGEDQFAKLGILVQVIAKLTRYAATPEGHADSIRDMKVYAAMLEDLHHDES